MKENCYALIVTNFDKADGNYTDAMCIGSLRIVSAGCHSGAKAWLNTSKIKYGVQLSFSRLPIFIHGFLKNEEVLGYSKGQGYLLLALGFGCFNEKITGNRINSVNTYHFFRGRTSTERFLWGRKTVSQFFGNKNYRFPMKILVCPKYLGHQK